MVKAAKQQQAATGPQQQQPPQQQQVQHQGPLAQLPFKLAPKKLRAQEINEHMVVVPGVLSIQEAQQLINAAESAGFEHQSSRGPAFGEAFRDNHRISMHDPGLADQLWRVAGLERVMQGVEMDGLVPVGCNANIRFYRWARRTCHRGWPDSGSHQATAVERSSMCLHVESGPHDE